MSGEALALTEINNRCRLLTEAVAIADAILKASLAPNDMHTHVP